MVNFKEEGHEYLSGSNKYTSVTTLLKQFDDTDWVKVKETYAKKNGLSIDDVSDKWKQQSDIGTLIHAQFEDSIENRIECATDQGVKYGIDLENLKPGVYTELIVYMHDYEIAGQIDKLIVHDDLSFSIEDYKTDFKIDKVSYDGFRSVNGKPVKGKQYFKHPISKIEKCNFNKYSLQLSTYAYILESYGYKLKTDLSDLVPRPELTVIHIETLRDAKKNHILNAEGKPTIVKQTIHEIPYLRKEVQSILNYHEILTNKN
jgi:hypothetical protein